jgi:antirestriction protein ArdC
MLQGFSNNHWATFKQWQEIGAQVNKGAKGTPIIFYKRTQYDKKLDKPNELGQTEVVEQGFVLKHSYVFNAAQVSGWVAPEVKALPDLTERITAADDFVTKTRAVIVEEGERALYNFLSDRILIPPRNLFVGTETCNPTEAYYSTLLHELTHWTGAESRCNRDFGKKREKKDYAMEELIAELGAAFLCVELQITLEPRPDHAAYIDGWLKIMKEDVKAIFEAARKATQAVDYLNALVTGNPYLQTIQEPETVVSEPQSEEPKTNLFVQTIQQKEPPRPPERERKADSKVERFLAIKSQKQGSLF